MRLLKLAVVCAAFLVAGCASDYSWQRRDGGRLGEDFQWSISECRRIAGRNDEEIMRRCMHRRGYVWAQNVATYDDYDYRDYRPRRRHHHHHYDD
jgi:hypothetical protein